MEAIAKEAPARATKAKAAPAGVPVAPFIANAEAPRKAADRTVRTTALTLSQHDTVEKQLRDAAAITRMVLTALLEYNKDESDPLDFEVPCIALQRVGSLLRGCLDYCENINFTGATDPWWQPLLEASKLSALLDHITWADGYRPTFEEEFFCSYLTAFAQTIEHALGLLHAARGEPAAKVQH